MPCKAGRRCSSRSALADWTAEHRMSIQDARTKFDLKTPKKKSAVG